MGQCISGVGGGGKPTCCCTKVPTPEMVPTESDNSLSDDSLDNGALDGDQPAKGRSEDEFSSSENYSITVESEQ